MAKKYHYYVLVMSDTGPVFVTKVSHKSQMSWWNKEEKPLELSLSEADDIALGLNLNYHLSYVVRSLVEIDSQPYRYSDFDFTFKEKNKEEESNEQ